MGKDLIMGTPDGIERDPGNLLRHRNPWSLSSSSISPVRGMFCLPGEQRRRGLPVLHRLQQDTNPEVHAGYTPELEKRCLEPPDNPSPWGGSYDP